MPSPLKASLWDMVKKAKWVIGFGYLRNGVPEGFHGLEWPGTARRSGQAFGTGTASSKRLGMGRFSDLCALSCEVPPYQMPFIPPLTFTMHTSFQGPKAQALPSQVSSLDSQALASQSFQRFAVRSSIAIENASRRSAKKTQQLKEQLEDFVDYVKSEHFNGPSSNKK
ncbi:hypothetical protein L7F22_065816 [Adiantum nelumboides]|nr:hypothetical protein [Adiantum nelumboides]